MPRRKLVFACDEFYHLFNRTVGKEEAFISKISLNKSLDVVDYYRFSQKIRYSQFSLLSDQLKKDYLKWLKKQTPLINIIAFAFMPNHYHFLVKQIEDNGILKFASNFQNSFAKYFNLKNNRQGSLFQHTFKAKRVEDDEELIHIARYIHLNPITALLIKIDSLSDYQWTSIPWYLNPRMNRFVEVSLLMDKFKTKNKLIQFHKDQADYQRTLSRIKRLILEK